jgi:dolichyldiphosphatase
MSCSIEDNLIPFSLTHVVYSQNDILGKPMAVLSLVPISLIVAYLTLIVVNRDTKILALFIGQLLNEGINKILKNTIKEPRPSSLIRDGSYGMPSSHSQFMFFFCSVCILYLRNNQLELARWMKPFLSMGVIGASIGVAWSRVYLRYHTVEQVVAGSILGIAIGTIWYFVAIPGHKPLKTKKE